MGFLKFAISSTYGSMSFLRGFFVMVFLSFMVISLSFLLKYLFWHASLETIKIAITGFSFMFGLPLFVAVALMFISYCEFEFEREGNGDE